MCNKIHLGELSLADRICSLLYDLYQKRPKIYQDLKFDQYSVNLQDFLKRYEIQYGEFTGYDSNHTSNGMMKEVRRVLIEYGNYYTIDFSSLQSDDNDENISLTMDADIDKSAMKKYRLWKLDKDHNIRFDSVGMWKKICFDHMDSACKFNPT